VISDQWSVVSGSEQWFSWKLCRRIFLCWVGVVLSEVAKMLGAVAAQLMSGEEVVVEGQSIPVSRVGRGRLRMVSFRMNGRMWEAIEQNPEKASSWGKLAREGHQVVQFRDLEMRKYVAVSVDGVVREY
jgi:hypothetical protein